MKARLREEAKAITEAQVDSHLVWDLTEEVDGGKVLKDKPDILGATPPLPSPGVQPKENKCSVPAGDL